MQFTEVLDHFFIEYRTSGHHHSRAGWVQLDCPLCGKGSHKFHLGYNIKGGYCNCWKCGKVALSSVFYSILGKARYGEAKELLGKVDVVQSPSIRFKGNGGVLKRPVNTGKLLKQHIKYLKARGFTKEQAQLWELKGIPVSIGFSWRVYIPIFYKGVEISYTTRAISNKATLRYRAAEESNEVYPHKKVLFGEQFVRDAVIITEGPFDAMSIGPGAVAVCGTSYSLEQVKEMVKFPTRVVCFDSEDTAQERAKNLTDTLSLYKGDTYNVTLDAKDAGSASKGEIEALRDTFLEYNN